MQRVFALPVRLGAPVGVLVLLALTIPAGAVTARAQFLGSKKKKDRNPQKTLLGQVVDKSGNGVAEAVVYLKDQRTFETQTHIADQHGNYRFSGLDPNTDYEVYAESKGSSSPKRKVSSFDSRTKIYLVLQISRSKRKR